MSDVAAIIDRLYRTYLYPPDSRPAQCYLNGAITDTATSLVLKNFVLPEDEELVKAGSIIEIGSELIQIVLYDDITKTATEVVRGDLGTTAVAHLDSATTFLAPAHPRQSVFEAVADNILTLYPKLYTVTTGSIVPVSAGVSSLDDDLAVEVVEAWEYGFLSSQDIDARIVDYHPATGGRSLITSVGTGQIWVRYRRRFGDAKTEAATWADLGFEERWANIVMAGAAGDLFAGRDLPASHTEWASAALEAENIPVGTRMSLARQLAAYRDHLLKQAQREMRAEYGTKVHSNSAGQIVTRTAFG